MSLGLRAKSALALCACIAIVLLLAVLAGWRAIRAIEENLGTAFARNVTQYNKQRILAPVSRELALSERMADSEVTRRWLLDESNPAKKALFFAEAERYRQAFADKSYFVASRASRNYYFNDTRSKHSDQPRYQLDASDPEEAWFFSTMKDTKEFNINVDRNPKINTTKIWFNVMVKDRGRNIGVMGTGLDFNRFLKQFITNTEAGVTPIILNQTGAIQAHRDPSLVDYSSISDKGDSRSTIFKLLARAEDRTAMQNAMQSVEKDVDGIQVFWANLQGKSHLFAVSYIPELKWHVLTSVDLKSARIIDSKLWTTPLLIGGALLILLVLAIVVAVDRILLNPLFKLTNSARAMAVGNYDAELPPATNDELGELTRAFGAMATQVRSHTDELEGKVRARTLELTSVNEQMAEASKKIGDSIQYASLIQNAILPNRDLDRSLADRYFVLWRPRDVVGGDFYVFRAEERGYLIGVVDCAGHGVPGALMTMIAHTVVNVAMDALGLRDPAALLGLMDARIHAMLQSDPSYAQLATHMDAGLAFVDFDAKTVTFAGAKVSLYWSDGEQVGEVKGDRHAIGGKRRPTFVNKTTPMDPKTTFYLTTDGMLDQAGGPKGYSFGHARFAALMQRHAKLPFAQQKDAFAEELAEYQGTLAQRDDITVLSFRFTEL
jgi:serine phosphatase RsbU (regulator of sigma subunit)